MKTISTPLSRSTGALLILSISPLLAEAQIPYAWEGFQRTQKAEFYGIGQYLHSATVEYNGPGGTVKLDMDDTGLGGLGMAYHFNDFLALRFDFMFGGATFRTEGTGGTPLTLANDAFLHTGRVNLDYNIINRRLTPFVTAGIGYQYLSAELENHPDVGYCWWDPWYGWVCAYGKPIYEETDFTWNVGAGLRWNITDNFFIKATGGATWLQYEDARDITTQIEAIFSLGWTF